MAEAAAAALLADKAVDDDVRDYLVGTIDSCLEEGDVSVDALTEALSELLVSYELADDEDTAGAMCRMLHDRLSASPAAAAAVVTDDGAPPALLNKPLQMGDGGTDRVDSLLLGTGLGDVDAYGNKQSAAQRANAAWKPSALAATTATEEEDDDSTNGGVCFGMLRTTAASLEAQQKRELAEIEVAERAREKACELYLASKAAGGSRDVNVRSVILLAPTGKTLLEDGSSLRLVQGRRYGLVGRNGTGKTSLLKAIASYEITTFPSHLKVVHVEQDPVHDLSATPLAAVLKFDLEQQILRRRHAELSEACARAAAEAPPSVDLGEVEADSARKASEKAAARLQKRLEETEQLMADLQLDGAEARVGAILSGLGFSAAMQSAPIASLSGGWRMRVTLAAALFVPCDLLLLDEPTNHLDFPALVWLTHWLQACKCTCLIVSHDRGFLDDVVTDVVQMRAKTLLYFRGSISAFVAQEAEAKIAQRRRYEAQQAERKHMQEMIDKFDPAKNSSADNKKSKRHAGALSQAKQRERQLAKMEEEGLVTDPDAKQDEATISIAFPSPPPLKRPMLVKMSDVGFGYPPAVAGSSPRILLTAINLAVSTGSKIGILGPNGCGKSTLLKLMTSQLSATIGDVEINRGARSALFAQHFVEQLDLFQTPTEFLMARFAGAKEMDVRNRLGRFGIVDGMSWLPMGKLSGGQKSRVVLCAICWSEPTLLFLDEPTNHLDMETVDVLATALREFGGAVVVVSHDCYFLERAVAEFWSVRDCTLKRFTDLESAKRHAQAGDANSGVELD